MATKRRTLPAQPAADFAVHNGQDIAVMLRAHPSLQRSWQRGMSRGVFTDHAADEIAVKVFGTHPGAIWGRAWWDAA